MNALQTISLLIFAAFAAVVLYNLYGVLGKRIGRQPEDGSLEASPIRGIEGAPAFSEHLEEVALSGLAAVKAKDPTFELDAFLGTIRNSYEEIVKAFAANDLSALRSLTDPAVFDTFSKAIETRVTTGVAERIEFMNPARADLEAAEVDGETVRLRVRFLSEFRSLPMSEAAPVPASEADERRAAEMWTFERNATAKDARWILCRVEPAEA